MATPEPTEAAKLSRMLFEAREHLSMWDDVVTKRVGRRDDHLVKLIDDIDHYRAVRGWSPNGYGGEQDG